MDEQRFYPRWHTAEATQPRLSLSHSLPLSLSLSSVCRPWPHKALACRFELQVFSLALCYPSLSLSLSLSLSPSLSSVSFVSRLLLRHFSTTCNPFNPSIPFFSSRFCIAFWERCSCSRVSRTRRRIQGARWGVFLFPSILFLAMVQYLGGWW